MRQHLLWMKSSSVDQVDHFQSVNDIIHRQPHHSPHHTTTWSQDAPRKALGSGFQLTMSKRSMNETSFPIPPPATNPTPPIQQDHGEHAVMLPDLQCEQLIELDLQRWSVSPNFIFRLLLLWLWFLSNRVQLLLPCCFSRLIVKWFMPDRYHHFFCWSILFYQSFFSTPAFRSRYLTFVFIRSRSISLIAQSMHVAVKYRQSKHEHSLDSVCTQKVHMKTKPHPFHPPTPSLSPVSPPMFLFVVVETWTPVWLLTHRSIHDTSPEAKGAAVFFSSLTSKAFRLLSVW